MTDRLWLIIGISITYPAVLGFVVLYGLLSPWYRSTIGRATFINSLGLCGLVTAGVVRILFGDDNAFFVAMRIFIYTVLPVGAWYVLYAYVKTYVLAALDVQRGVTHEPEVDETV